MARRAFCFCGSRRFRRLLAIFSIGVLAASAASYAVAGDRRGARAISALAFRIDHFECYRVDPTSPDRPHSVLLRDQFGSRRGAAFPLVTLCNSVRKNGSLVRNPRAHLACYTLRSSQPFTSRQVTVTNQLQPRARIVVVGPVRLCLPSGKSLDPKLRPPPARGLDHFECYTIKPVTQFRPKPVKLLDEFKPGTSARVVRPLLLCAPVSKNGGKLVNARDHLVCYELTPNPYFKARRVSISNQFTGAGKATLVAFRVENLCVPSLKK